MYKENRIKDDRNKKLYCRIHKNIIKLSKLISKIEINYDYKINKKFYKMLNKIPDIFDQIIKVIKKIYHKNYNTKIYFNNNNIKTLQKYRKLQNKYYNKSDVFTESLLCLKIQFDVIDLIADNVEKLSNNNKNILERVNIIKFLEILYQFLMIL